jgi:hypothetical protein
MAPLVKLLGVLTLACFTLACAQPPPPPAPLPGTAFAPEPGAAPASAGQPAAPAPSLDPWPRSIQAANATLLVYQPQVESWQGNQLKFRAAVGATPSGASNPTYGVIWGSASTEVDRGRRQVSLFRMQLTRASFPTLPDRGAGYLGALRSQLASAAQTISLDRLAASLAASGSHAAGHVAVQNAPPQILISNTPAVSIPIDGNPVLRPLPPTAFQRVINTRACMLLESSSGTYFMHLYDGWLQASGPLGPWAQATDAPLGIDDVANRLVAQHTCDPLSGGSTQPPPSLANGVPTVYVTTTPAELIVFNGPPDFQPIGATPLLWANNTRADVIVDSDDNRTYALLSGRWYRAPSLSGPWSYVASASLPAAFRSIPAGSAAGVVLPAVAGTPQAREAVIENSIPQTASVPLSGGPTFAASYDGPPRFQAIPGSSLQYIENTGTPVIRVDADSWYALVAGIWFVAPAPQGPWSVAASVPAAIYTIPPSSPLYYVTYVQIYGGTETVVYEGYTPGYMGTVVSPDDVVVYGTGYDYDPWIGETWYAPPETWGVMAQPVYNPAVGYTYGFALGLATASMVALWASPVYYDIYYHGYPCCGSATVNVYGHYGYTSISGTQKWYANSSGTYGVKGSGSYENYRTGTTGSYNTNRSYNPYTGQRNASIDRSYDRTNGTTGNVSRDASYNYQTGKGSYDSSRETTTASGATVDHDVSASTGEGVQRSTTVDTASGQTYSHDSGYDDGQRYAGSDGNVYKSDGAGGWQSSGSNGWSNASGDNSWANREQQGRSASDQNFGGFQNGGFADRGQGGGSGGFEGGGDRFGGAGGGFGGGGFGGGGGGFGGRFGGGGFGGGRR